MENGKVDEAPSLCAQEETDAFVKHYYSAQDVADAFVKQYYNILQASPKNAHKFYKDQSILTRPGPDGSMKSATTVKDINDEIMASNIKDWNPDLISVRAQDSIMESVIVGVTGSLTDNDNVMKQFTHTFFLAPQEGGGFYVHNDFLQFIGTNNILETLTCPDSSGNSPISSRANAKGSSSDTVQVTYKDRRDKATSTEEDSNNGNKVAGSSEGKSALPAQPDMKGVSPVSHPAPNMQEDAKRVSYASILAKETSVASAPQTSPKAVARFLTNTDRQSSASLVVPKSAAVPLKALTPPTPINGVAENIYDIKSIRVKDLPPKMNQDSLLEVVKKFGPVKHKNIQIKEYPEDGYRYAFVEFDNAKSARSAVEAGSIKFGDKECEIQYKRSSNQGRSNYTGRPTSGRGGFHNDSSRARDSEGRGGGSWGKYDEPENHGNYSGQSRGYNYRRNGGYT